jgi:hypothetical protein
MTLRNMTLEQLGTAFRNSDYGDGRPAYTIEQFCAELRRRDEATRKLVESARRGLERIESDYESPSMKSHDGNALRAALAQFPKE